MLSITQITYDVRRATQKRKEYLNVGAQQGAAALLKVTVSTGSVAVVVPVPSVFKGPRHTGKSRLIITESTPYFA